MSSRLFRLDVRVPLEHVFAVRAYHGERGQSALLADIETRLARLGWSDAVAMQDPTYEELVSVTARKRTSSPRPTDGVIVVEGAEEFRDRGRVRESAPA